MAGAVCDRADRGGAVDLSRIAKDPMSGMHHAMMTMAEYAPSHQMAMMHADASTPQRSHGVPLDHAEACGYCVLLAHVRA